MWRAVRFLSVFLRLLEPPSHQLQHALLGAPESSAGYPAVSEIQTTLRVRRGACCDALIE
jgi:hypothetical protein